MVREGPLLEPLLPVVGCAHEPLIGLVVGGGQRVLGPAQRRERRLPFAQDRARAGARALEPEVHVGDEPQLRAPSPPSRPWPRCSRGPCRTTRRPAPRSRRPVRSRGESRPIPARSAPCAAAHGLRRSSSASAGGCASAPRCGARARCTAGRAPPPTRRASPSWSRAPACPADSAPRRERSRPAGPSRKPPASRSSIAPNTLGESNRGRHIHSTLPLGAISAQVSQSDRKP